MMRGQMKFAGGQIKPKLDKFTVEENIAPRIYQKFPVKLVFFHQQV